MFTRCAGAPGNIVALQIHSNRFRLLVSDYLWFWISGATEITCAQLRSDCEGADCREGEWENCFFSSLCHLWPIWVTIILILFPATWNPPDARRTEGLSLAEGKGSLKYEIQMYMCVYVYIYIHQKSYYSG